ncbi:MAG TPA: condensation domain-containing protein, partial [Candidatus Angelobacter sp.]|nr:condensation domain-containing protein [Candidatus Angelobacter sp.]
MDTNTIAEVSLLSPAQQEILKSSSSNQARNLGCSQICATIRGALDPAMLQRAWETLNEHPLLRTFFIVDNGSAEEAVANTSQTKFRYEPWSRSPENQWKTLTRTYAHRNRERGFEVSQRPLARLDVFRTGQSEHQLYLTYLDLLFDEPSAGILMDRLLTLYAAIDGSKEPSLGYPEFLQFVKTGNSDETKTYWLTSLSDSVEPSLPISDRPASWTSKVAPAEELFIFQIPPDLSSSLLRTADTWHTVPTFLLELATLLALEMHSPGCAFVMRSVRNCEPASNSHFMAGSIAHMLPLQIGIDHSQTGSTWIQSLRSQVAQLEQNSFVTLSDALNWAGQEAGYVAKCSRFIPTSLSASQYVSQHYGHLQV